MNTRLCPTAHPGCPTARHSQGLGTCRAPARPETTREMRGNRGKDGARQLSLSCLGCWDMEEGCGDGGWRGDLSPGSAPCCPAWSRGSPHVCPTPVMSSWGCASVMGVPHRGGVDVLAGVGWVSHGCCGCPGRGGVVSHRGDLGVPGVLWLPWQAAAGEAEALGARLAAAQLDAEIRLDKVSEAAKVN